MKKILMFLPLVSHASVGRIAAFGSCNVELHVVDTSTRKISYNLTNFPFCLIHKIHNYDAANDDPLYSHGNRYISILNDILRSKNFLPENKKNKEKILNIIHSVNPDLIVTYYGAQGAHYARIIVKSQNKVPVVAIMNLFPQTLERENKIARFFRRPFINEFSDYNYIKNKVHKFVCASEEMKIFLEYKLKVPPEKTLILPDFLPKTVQPSNLLSPQRVGSNRKIIFLGAPERWGADIDMVDDQFLEICTKKIDVYAGSVRSDVIKTGFGHKYNYFTDDQVFAGELSTYAQSFDAALITYNSLKRRERFRTTLPTRFFSAISAGIPIAVRAGIFDAVESFINEHKNGFVYKNSEELYKILSQTEKLDEYRSNAINLLGTAFSENQVESLSKLISDLEKNSGT